MKTTIEMDTAEVTIKTKWNIDNAHSEIAFSVKHLMITNVRGVFKEFNASIYTTAKDFMTVEMDFWLNPASIDTGDVKRDEHLKGADFFDVDNHKQITFIGNTYQKEDAKNKYTLYGELAMKGISKQIKLDVEFGGTTKDPWGNEKAGFTITGKINRKDWGLTWNNPLEAGGMLVSDEVLINCEVQLLKQD